MVSLALKTTTQSIIVSKLSAYARKNKTRQALWEYDNIIKSLYLLDYVDSVPLRQNVQRALNRGESYHQLRRSVSYANFGKLRFKTEYEQQIWGDCARLLTNCIIYYNASILSDLLTHSDSCGDTARCPCLARCHQPRGSTSTFMDDMSLVGSLKRLIWQQFFNNYYRCRLNETRLSHYGIYLFGGLCKNPHDPFREDFAIAGWLVAEKLADSQLDYDSIICSR